jgi:serine/threonine protein kinase
MRQLLLGLDHCHSHGILHRDIKGSNLLIDQNGNLKIGDFGLATFFQQKQPLTSRVVTLWYRPPELLLGATDYGVAVDLWSSGCILAELFAGKPIMPGRTEVLFPSFSWILRNMQVLYTELDVLNLYPV